MLKQLRKRVASRHSQIKVGSTYFLSNFYDKEGAMVKVLSKSCATNRAGWNSSVNVVVLDSDYHYYVIGATHTVNASNLYDLRSQASAEYRYGNQ
jgi:hypothetical protein